MPGFGVGDHQVSRHPVAVHGDDRLRQRGGDELVARLVPGRLSRPRSRRRRIRASTHQSGKSASSRRSSASSYGGSAAAGTLSCQVTSAAIASRIRRSARRSVAARLRGLQRMEVELAAEIVEEEKAVAGVGLEDARGVQAGGRDQAGDVDERPDVFLRRRRVHDDDAAAALRGRRGSSGESWRRSTPAASVAATTAWRGPTRPSQAKNAAARAGSLQAMAEAGEGGGVTGECGGRASGEEGNASWIIDSTNRCRSAAGPAPSPSGGPRAKAGLALRIRPPLAQ